MSFSSVNSDLFKADKYIPRTNSEHLNHFYSDNRYSTEAALIHGELEHKAEIFIPNEAYEQTLSDIEYDLADWGGSYSKRRAIEKKTARYLIDKVAPAGVMGNAVELGERLLGCRNSGVLGINQSTGARVVRWEHKCGLVKLCPDEARAEQKRLAKRYVPVAADWLDERVNRQFNYAVFAPPNAPFGGLQAAINAGFASIRGLLRHKSMNAVKGAFVTMECPMAKDGKSWNLHFNCLFLVDGYFDYKKVRSEFGHHIHFKGTADIMEVTRGYLERQAERNGNMLDLSRSAILRAAFTEIIKYSSKHVSEKSATGRTDAPAITDWQPVQFAEWYAAHHGLRRCRSYGVLYGVSEPELEPMNVQWIGSMDYTRSGYVFSISRRGLIKSIQGNKLTKNKEANSRQASLIATGAPPGE